MVSLSNHEVAQAQLIHARPDTELSVARVMPNCPSAAS